jgi:hypothetical protein
MKIKFNLLSALSMLLACSSIVTAQSTQEDWQKKAVADYPDLGVQGSELNTKFVQRVRFLRSSNAAFFEDPRWPYIVAEEVSKKSVIPGLETVTPANSETSRTVYVENQKVEIVDAKDVVAKATKGQSICLEGVIVSTTQRTLSAKDSFTVKLSPDILCEFKVTTFLERNRRSIPDFGHSLYSSDAKIVIENNAVSIYAPPAYKKPSVKVGQILKSGDKVVIYGQYNGLGYLGVDKGHLINGCLWVKPSR